MDFLCEKMTSPLHLIMDITNYNRIAKAIQFIEDHFKEQPDLAVIAKHINLSSYHFQRLFSDFAGTSPKNFLQFVNISYAKEILKRNNSITISELAFETGLSSTSRVHDLFVKIEGMTPSEYKNQGEGLLIRYKIYTSLFGLLLIASTSKGICYLAFEESEKAALVNVIQKFPNAKFILESDQNQLNVLSLFQKDFKSVSEIKIHLKGSEFQLKIWATLLKIPFGELMTYGEVAKIAGNPNASRAVGTAIGSNLIAYLIPCHRVIQATGAFGGYRWGMIRKKAIIAWEGLLSNKIEK